MPKQFKDGVLIIPRAKGGKTGEYEGGDLEVVVDYVLYNRWGKNVKPMGHLFTTRAGKPYLPSGFRSIWRRQMNKFVAAGGERFNEHDVRAYTASEAETLEHAQALLGHQPASTTKAATKIPNKSHLKVIEDSITWAKISRYSLGICSFFLDFSGNFGRSSQIGHFSVAPVSTHD